MSGTTTVAKLREELAIVEAERTLFKSALTELLARAQSGPAPADLSTAHVDDRDAPGEIGLSVADAQRRDHGSVHPTVAAAHFFQPRTRDNGGKKS